MDFFTKPKRSESSSDAGGLAVSRLRALEQAAADGRKLQGNADRLRAAWHLRRAWQKAKTAGLKKEVFQERVLDALEHSHGRRESFKLQNYLLPRRHETVTAELIKAYDMDPKRTEPLRALEPYIKGIEVAAVWCDADPDAWKLDFLQETTLWQRSVPSTSVQAPDGRPAETLALLLSVLCKSVARKHDLSSVYAALRSLACRWEMFDDRLVPYEGACMQWVDSPISPMGWTCYFEESMPYPSVPLLRIPYLVSQTRVCVAPDKKLWESDILYANSPDYLRGGIGIGGVHGVHYTFPESAKDQRQVAARVVYEREIRLCIVPDGHEGFSPALESRPRVTLNIAEDDALAGTYTVKAAWKPDFGEALFYARRPDDGPVLPTIRDAAGVTWRVRWDDPELKERQIIVRDPETTGWQFDADPLGAPGIVEDEPWYLSYTPATPAYLTHWLLNEWSLDGALAECPWSRFNGTHGVDDDRYNKDLPPLHELKFPLESDARSVECCLHNGLIEEALDAAAARIVDQVSSIQQDWVSRSEAHVQKLLSRWSRNSAERS